MGELLIEDEKAEYLLHEHHVRPNEIVEVLENEPRYFLRSAERELYTMVGQTSAGRWMVVSIQPFRESAFRVVTAYWNNDGRAEKLWRQL